MEILTGFLVAVIIAVVAYLVASVVPFLKPHANMIGVVAFLVGILLYVL